MYWKKRAVPSNVYHTASQFNFHNFGFNDLIGFHTTLYTNCKP